MFKTAEAAELVDQARAHGPITDGTLADLGHNHARTQEAQRELLQAANTLRHNGHEQPSPTTRAAARAASYRHGPDLEL